MSSEAPIDALFAPPRRPTDVPNVWFAIRVEYRREQAVKAYLDSIGVECFLPMQYREVVIRQRKVRKLMPLIHNLIFMHTTKPVIDRIKTTTAYPIRYLMQREGATSRPIVVPDDQMHNFIRVAGTFDDQLVWIPEQELPLTTGDRVRILGGPFAGAEGIYLRIKGSRARRVVVRIPGIAAVATATIAPSMVERIKK